MTLLHVIQSMFQLPKPKLILSLIIARFCMYELIKPDLSGAFIFCSKIRYRCNAQGRKL